MHLIKNLVKQLLKITYILVFLLIIHILCYKINSYCHTSLHNYVNTYEHITRNVIMFVKLSNKVVTNSCLVIKFCLIIAILNDTSQNTTCQPDITGRWTPADTYVHKLRYVYSVITSCFGYVFYSVMKLTVYWEIFEV